MAFDLLIKNGTIYDGNGGEAYKADIAVKELVEKDETPEDKLS